MAALKKLQTWHAGCICGLHAIVRICAVHGTVSVVVHARAFLTLATRSCAMFTALSRYYDERHVGPAGRQIHAERRCMQGFGFAVSFLCKPLVVYAIL